MWILMIHFNPSLVSMLSVDFRFLSLSFRTSEICCLLILYSWAKFVPFSPLSKRDIIICLSLIDRHVFDLSLRSIARVFTWPKRKELIKHEIHVATKQLSQSDISCTHQNISISRCTFEFWKAHRIMCRFNNLLKGLLGFLRLSVFKITTN